MNEFFKPFLTLFGIGLAISFAKWLGNRSSKTMSEVFSEALVSGFFATGAAAVMVFYPGIPFVAVAGMASLGCVLGIAFFSEPIRKALDSRLGNTSGS